MKKFAKTRKFLSSIARDGLLKTLANMYPGANVRISQSIKPASEAIRYRKRAQAAETKLASASYALSQIEARTAPSVDYTPRSILHAIAQAGYRETIN